MTKKMKLLLTCLLLLVSFALCTAIFLIFSKDRTEPVIAELPPTTARTTEPPTEPPTTEPMTYPVYDTYTPSENGVTDNAKVLLSQNKDYAGWLKIDGTYVDYPVFKDPGQIPAGVEYYGNEAFEANEFYLHHAMNGGYEFAGSLYIDYCDNFGSVEEDQSENIVIYGHNMANNTMFGSLRWYRQQPSYYQQYPFIQLSSNYKTYDYVIVACLITGGNWYSDFRYWVMEELDSEREFNEYMKFVREKQLSDMGIDVRYGDKLLTLSTCYADEDNSRFLVIARRLRDGESAEDYSTIQRTGE